MKDQPTADPGAGLDPQPALDRPAPANGEPAHGPARRRSAPTRVARVREALLLFARAAVDERVRRAVDAHLGRAPAADGNCQPPGPVPAGEHRKDAVEFLREMLVMNRHLHVMSNAKSGTVLVIATLFAGVVFTVVKDAGLLTDRLAAGGLFLMLGSIASSAACIIHSIFPRDGTFDRHNLLYFSDFARAFPDDPDAYLAAFMDRLDSCGGVRCFAREALAYGQMLRAEYRWQRRAIYGLLGVPIALAVLAVACVIGTPFR